MLLEGLQEKQIQEAVTQIVDMTTSILQIRVFCATI